MERPLRKGKAGSCRRTQSLPSAPSVSSCSRHVHLGAGKQVSAPCAQALEALACPSPCHVAPRCQLCPPLPPHHAPPLPSPRLPLTQLSLLAGALPEELHHPLSVRAPAAARALARSASQPADPSRISARSSLSLSLSLQGPRCRWQVDPAPQTGDGQDVAGGPHTAEGCVGLEKRARAPMPHTQPALPSFPLSDRRSSLAPPSLSGSAEITIGNCHIKALDLGGHESARRVRRRPCPFSSGCTRALHPYLLTPAPRPLPPPLYPLAPGSTGRRATLPAAG